MDNITKPNLFIQISKWIFPASLFLSSALVLFEKTFKFGIGGEYVAPNILNVEDFYLKLSVIIALLVVIYIPVVTYYKVYKNYTYQLFPFIFLNYVIVILISLLLIMAADGLGLLTFFDKLIAMSEQHYLVNGYLFW